MKKVKQNGRFYFTCEMANCRAQLVAKMRRFHASGKLLHDWVVRQSLTSNAVKVEEVQPKATEPTAGKERTPEGQTRSESFIRRAGRSMKRGLHRLKGFRSKNASASCKGLQAPTTEQVHRSRDSPSWSCPCCGQQVLGSDLL